jgi:hypothetical protein
VSEIDESKKNETRIRAYGTRASCQLCGYDGGLVAPLRRRRAFLAEDQNRKENSFTLALAVRMIQSTVGTKLVPA